ncbi:hypothetical protein D9758_008590 [Tetrapyrgos nigripes]|uniref:Glycoside hydrolase family 71 protein n=1 Tax=Tetrapyrgos nigripes TaxID=182062 RepID=A0A8H5LIN8_9AGAR|nr:hypothetical protein D9758_008590 [Tetrapyrgos nigripes]
MRASLLHLFGLLLGAVASVVSLPNNATDLSSRQAATNKLVFCHFMIGIVSNRNSAADFDDDMKRAKALGIDAFALNIGTDPFTDTQLEFAYASAANNGMKVFISFDFNWWNTGQTAEIASKITHYGALPAQLRVDNNKIFVSSFAGDGLNVAALRSAVGQDIYFAPNFHPGQSDFGAPAGGNLVTVHAGDQSYVNTLAGKGYIAPASPWFSTHFGPEVSYSKNWVFPGDLLWYQRWHDILTLQPRFVEIVTWNDYGESHYIGPLSSPHTDDGSSKWVNDMPHKGWLDMAKPFIAAYKAGSPSVDPFITSDQLIYWYRITPKDLNCDATDTTMVPANNASGNYFEGRPNGFEAMTDDVFVVSLLTSPGTVTVNSGAQKYTFDAPSGASAFAVPFRIGAQSFALSRGGNQVIGATSLKVIQDTCPCGLYKFNPYVGTVPESDRDALQGASLSSFTNGLKVAYNPAPSLPASPPATTAATATSSATAAPITVSV